MPIPCMEKMGWEGRRLFISMTLFGGKGANQAIAAGVLTTTKLGAQPSLPSQPDLERFLRKQGKKG